MKKNGVIDEKESMLVYEGEVVCASISDELPSYYILPNDRLPNIRNQLTTSMCVAFAISGILQVFNRIEVNNDELLSPGFIYTQCRKHKGDGLIPGTTLDLLIEKGCCLHKDFPYVCDVPDIINIAEKEITDKAKEYALNHRIKGYISHLLGSRQKNVVNIKKSLYEHKIPVLLSTDSFGARHAVLIIGWDDSKERFIILNSWGEKWGKNGIGTVVPYSASNRAYTLFDDENIFDNIPFTDVSKNDWFYKAVKKCYYAGLMKGTSSSSFEPNKGITRAEVAQLMYNIHNKLNSVYHGKLKRFNDVSDDKWYYDAVGYCLEHNLMVGVSNTEFEPDRIINRAELAQILYNLTSTLKLNIVCSSNVPFVDVPKGEWFFDAVKYCYERGLLNGKSETVYEPNAEVLRCEVAQAVYNYCKKIDEVEQE